jgi:DNA adenine methylase
MQMELFGDEAPSAIQRIVNVASVPQRSPFRYPGGKTWLVPRIREWLGSRLQHPALFLEPFAGGGIISLTVAAEGLADQVVIVELDADVAAVWQAIITDGDGPWLADQIISFKLTPTTVADELSREPTDNRMRAWRTLLKNRVNRGGILAPGAGLIRYGEGGKGLASRWYPQTLSQRIHELHAIRHRIAFRQGDGLSVMREYVDYADSCIFIDPPYTAGGKGKRAGARLYTHSTLDHEALFAIAQNMAGDVLMTYDNNAEVVELATRHGFATAAIPMKNTHHAEMTELLIGRRLDWLAARHGV